MLLDDWNKQEVKGRLFRSP